MSYQNERLSLFSKIHHLDSHSLTLHDFTLSVGIATISLHTYLQVRSLLIFSQFLLFECIASLLFAILVEHVASAHSAANHPNPQ